MMRCARLLCLALALVLLGVASARAAGADAVPPQCVALHALGQHPMKTLTRWATECAEPSEKAAEVRAEVLRAVEYLDDVALTVVLDAFAGEDAGLQLGWPSDWDKRQGCTALAASLTQELSGPAPLLFKTESCRGALGKSGANEVAFAFASSAGAADRVELVVAGEDPGRTLLADPVRLARKDVFLASLPKGVPYVARFLQGDEIAGVVRGKAAEDVQVWEPAPLKICHEIDLALNDPESIVLLDGRRLDSARHWHADGADRRYFRLVLAPGQHELVVLGYDPQVADLLRGDKLFERLRTRFEAPTDSAQCRRMSYDLRELARVALVDVDVDDRCLEAGLSQPQVVTAANAFLRAELGAERFVDSEAVRALFSGIAGFSEAFVTQTESTLPEEAVTSNRPSTSDDRGDQSPSKQQAEIAHQYLRRGIQTALILTVQCTRFGGESDWTHTFTAQSLSLDSKGVHVDPLTGAAPPEVRSQSETVRDSSLLFHAVSAPLARLLDRPYVRFSSPKVDQRVHSWDRFTAVEFRPSDVAEAEAHRELVFRRRLLAVTEAGRICPRLSDHAQLRGQLPPSIDDPADEWEQLSDYEGAPPGGESSLDQWQVARAPGHYLTVVKSTRKASREQLQDARCVYVEPFGARVALTISYALYLPGPRDDYSAATLEYTLPLREGAVYNLRGGFFVGAAHSSFFRATPPGWAPNLAVDEGGRAAISWTRDEFLFGVHSDVRGNLGRFVWFAALQLPTIGIGPTRAMSSPDGLSDFSGAYDSGIDVDIGVMLRAGFGVIANQAMDVNVGAQVGMLAADDWLTSSISSESQTALRSITYDPSATVGLFAEVGYFR